jgi:hypothetical protein
MPVWLIICLVVAALLYVVYVPTFVGNIRDHVMPVWIGIPAVLFAPIAVVVLFIVVLLSQGPRAMFGALMMAIVRW